MQRPKGRIPNGRFKNGGRQNGRRFGSISVPIKRPMTISDGMVYGYTLWIGHDAGQRQIQRGYGARRRSDVVKLEPCGQAHNTITF